MNLYFTYEFLDTLRSVNLFITVKAVAKLNLGHRNNLKNNFKQLAVVVPFLQTTQNWSFHVVVLQRTEKKCTKIYNARNQLLFCSLLLLFSDVAVAVVVILNSLIVHLTKLLNFDWSRTAQLIPNCTPQEYLLNFHGNGVILLNVL